MTTLIYSLVLPENQAVGASGSLIDQMVDCPGNFKVVNFELFNAVDDYSGKNFLALPPSGTDSITGEAYAGGNQCVVVRWQSASNDSLTLGFHLDFDESDPSNQTLQQSLFVNFDLFSNVIAAGQTGVGNTILYDAAPPSEAFSSANEYYCVVAIEQVNASTINLYADYRNASAPGTILKRSTALGITVSGSEFLTGSVGIGARSATAPKLSEFTYYDYAGTITSSPSNATDLPTIGGSSSITPPVVSLTNGAIASNSVGGVSQTTASFTATGAIGGADVLEYQWLSGPWGTDPASMTEVGSPQTGLASGVAPTGLTNTTSPGTRTAVALRVTDGTTTVYSPIFQYRTYTNPDLCLLFIGDSIGQIANTWTDTTGGGSVTNNRTPIDDACELLQVMLDRRVIYVNACQSGAKSFDWKDLSGGYLPSAVSSYESLMTTAGYTGQKYAVSMLGANDCLYSTAKATYKSQVQSRVEALIADDYICIEHYPSYASDGSNGGLNTPGSLDLLLNQYPAALEELAGSVTGMKLGDTSRVTQGAFANNAGNHWQRDGLHPLALGATQLARSQAQGVASVIQNLSQEIDDVTAQQIIDGVIAGILKTPGNKLESNSEGQVTLSSEGLDAIAVTDPGGPAGHTTLPKQIAALWRAVFGKTSLGSGTYKMYGADGTTVNSTQAMSDDGTTQTKGEAS